MGTFVSKPRDGDDNSPKKGRARTLSGSNLFKKPAIFKSSSKPRDITEVKSATLQPTGNRDNLLAPSNADAELVATTSTGQLRSSAIAADSQLEYDNAVQAKEDVSKTAKLELDNEMIEKEKLQFTVKKREGCESEIKKESLKCENNTDKVLNNVCATETDFHQESGKEKYEKVIETSPLSSITGDFKQHKPETNEPESDTKVECSNQESKVAESLVEEALKTGIEIWIADLESAEKVPINYFEPIKPESPAKCEPPPSEPKSSEQTSDYTEVFQQTPSVIEFVADPYDKSDSSNIAVTSNCEFKKVLEYPPNCATNGLDKAPHGDDGDNCMEKNPKSILVASKLTANEHDMQASIRD